MASHDPYQAPSPRVAAMERATGVTPVAMIEDTRLTPTPWYERYLPSTMRETANVALDLAELPSQAARALLRALGMDTQTPRLPRFPTEPYDEMAHLPGERAPYEASKALVEDPINLLTEGGPAIAKAVGALAKAAGGVSSAAAPLWRMSAFQKIRMYGAQELGKGRSVEEIVQEMIPHYQSVKPERIHSQVMKAAEDVARIHQDSGGVAFDPDHYRRYIEAGRLGNAPQWYDEMVPFVLRELPRRRGEPLIDGRFTWRQRTAIKAYAAFGSNAGPLDDYRKFVKVLAGLQGGASDPQQLLDLFPWGMTAKTGPTGTKQWAPGLQSLRNYLEKDIPLGNRKIESYDYNLADERRPGYLGELEEPATVDRHIFRGAGLPTEAVDEAGNTLRQAHRSTAQQSVYLGDGPLANSAYQIIEDNIRRVGAELGLSTKEAQAAFWKAWRDEYEFFERGRAATQGYPVGEQHTLQQAIASLTPQEMSDISNAASETATLTRREGGATVLPGVGNAFGLPRTSVAVAPERTRYVPPGADLDSALQAYAKDNTDALTRGAAVVAWKTGPTDNIKIGTRPAPIGTTVLDTVALPSNARDSLQGKLMGMKYGQEAVFDLGAKPGGLLHRTHGVGKGTTPLPELIARLADARRGASPRLLAELRRRGPTGDPSFDQLLADLEAQMAAHRAKRSGGGSR
jgi:hypothetical protein